MDNQKVNFKEKLIDYLNRIPIVERKTYVVIFCVILILGCATKSMVKIVGFSDILEIEKRDDNQLITQQQLNELSSELNRVHDHFTSSRDSFLILIEELDTLKDCKNEDR